MLTRNNIAATFTRLGEHLSRMGTHNHNVYKSRGMEPPGHACDECHNEVDYFMLTDEAWASVAVEQSGMLCLTCAEKHLGRPFKIEDFSEAPVNRLIILGIRLGLEAGAPDA